MGNHASHSGGPGHATGAPGAPGGPNEPLESYLREKQRDEHLKNLGMRRSRSIRRSISKRLRRRNKQKREDAEASPPEGGPPAEADREEPGRAVEVKADRAPSVERLDRLDYPEPKRRLRPLVGEPQPMPSHVQDDSDRPSSTARRMDRLRRSLRSSLRRRKDRGGAESSLQGTTTTDGGKGGGGSGDGGKPHQWQSDEVAVRSGTCSFHVKYLGCVEVFESRGMQVCEEAVRVLKNSKRKSVRAILYVHGDGLRVVDDDTKGLIVDQTIEKVSFCAPDRNFEKGFSYICRDGTTRRWMCHGFMASKESGERLSHAVGCAFAICLEKKQQRDKLCTVSMTFDQSNSSFTRYGSFRQTSITERLQDPRVLKPSHDPIPLAPVENPYAVARPHATDSMLQRQTSFRGFNQLHASGNSPFKRQLSLRLGELPSTLARQQQSGFIVSGLDNCGLEEVFRVRESPMATQTTGVVPVQVLKNHLSQLYQLSEDAENKKLSEANHYSETKFDAIAEAEDESSELASPTDPISSMCQQLSQELYFLSNKRGDVAKGGSIRSNNLENGLAVASSQQYLRAMPYIPMSSASPLASVMEEPAGPGEKDPLANVKAVQYDNPWDFVPDQPHKAASTTAANCDSSSGISSTSGHSGHNAANVFSSSSGDDWFGQHESRTNGLASHEMNGSDHKWNSGEGDRNKDEFWSTTESGILDDPFDAEWAALATRNNSKNVTNPFTEERTSGDGTVRPNIKAFELQM